MSGIHTRHIHQVFPLISVYDPATNSMLSPRYSTIPPHCHSLPPLLWSPRLQLIIFWAPIRTQPSWYRPWPLSFDLLRRTLSLEADWTVDWRSASWGAICLGRIAKFAPHWSISRDSILSMQGDLHSLRVSILMIVHLDFLEYDKRTTQQSKVQVYQVLKCRNKLYLADFSWKYHSRGKTWS